MRPRPRALSAKRSSALASCRHGSHQLAQKVTSVWRPRAEASRLASVTRGPDRYVARSCGAGRRAALLSARPKMAKAAIAAIARTEAANRRREKRTRADAITRGFLPADGTHARRAIPPSAKTVANLPLERILQKNMVVCSAFVPSPAAQGVRERGNQSGRKRPRGRIATPVT